MELQINFKYRETDLSRSLIVSDELTSYEAETVWRAMKVLTDTLQTITTILNNHSPVIEDEGALEVDDSYCYICDRGFASPGNLKQHRTVKHNGEGND